MRGIRYRDEIKHNLEHLEHLVKAASWLSAMALPVRLITIPEGALQGFNDEVLDHDHEWFARECAIDIPGPETDALGRMAATYDAYVMATAKARHPSSPAGSSTSGSRSPRSRRSCSSTTRSCRCCRSSTRSPRTTCGTGGSSSTGTGSTPSTRWPTPRSDASA